MNSSGNYAPLVIGQAQEHSSGNQCVEVFLPLKGRKLKIDYAIASPGIKLGQEARPNSVFELSQAELQ